MTHGTVSYTHLDVYKRQPEDSEIVFLRGQVEKLQAELEKEREHNREKDKQLLDTLNKLAESQAALAAGQAADKQKAVSYTHLDVYKRQNKRHWRKK